MCLGLFGGGRGLLRRALGFGGGGGCRLAGVDLAQGALVFVREHLHELGAGRGPVVQQLAGTLAAGPLVVVFQQFLQLCLIGLVAVLDLAVHLRFLLGG